MLVYVAQQMKINYKKRRIVHLHRAVTPRASQNHKTSLNPTQKIVMFCNLVPIKNQVVILITWVAALIYMEITHLERVILIY